MSTRIQLHGANNSDWFPVRLTDSVEAVSKYLTSTRAITSLGNVATDWGPANTVNGPTGGITPFSGTDVHGTWVSPIVTSDFTVSGTITINIWGLESSMSANVAINMAIYKLDCQSGALTLIAKSANVTELGTASAVNNFTVTPTSTNMQRGDRFVFQIFGDDAGTMATGFNFRARVNGASAGADGDTYVQFTETFAWLTNAVGHTNMAGTTLYLNDAAASGGINPGAATEKEAWTSQGSSSQTCVTNVGAGPTSGIQITKTAGGTAVEWYSRPLNAFTLQDAVSHHIRCFRSAGIQVGIGVEVAVTDNDGTNATVVGYTMGSPNNSGSPVIVVTSDTSFNSGNTGVRTTSVSNGQRLRFRLFLDDPALDLVSGGTVTVSYDGPTLAAGDSYVILNQSVTEFTGGAAEDPPPYVGGGFYGMVRDKSNLFVPENWRDKIVVPRERKLVLT